MGNWPVRRIHKWIGVTAGAFLLVWMITGIGMLIPIDTLRALIGSGPSSTSGPPDIEAGRLGPSGEEGDRSRGFNSLRVTVPEAIAVLERELGGSVKISEVRVVYLLDRLVYRIAVAGRGWRVVDGTSGEMIEISAGIAEAAAREFLHDSTAELESSLIRERDFFYPGELPVYRLETGGAWGAVVYVSRETGEILYATSGWSRLHAAVMGLHSFDPLRLLSERVQIGLLALISLIGAIGVCTGFYLALPARWRFGGSSVTGKRAAGRPG